MLRSLKDLEGYTVTATDGDIGSVVDFFLDDQRHTVRYLVVQTGGVFSGRRVLISPVFFRDADWSTHRFNVALTVDKVKHSPNVDVDKPVSRQNELEYHRYYGYPYYWGDSGVWGVGAYPNGLMTGGWTEPSRERSEELSGDTHLRSAREVRGYHIQGRDEAIGHVEDFVVDDLTWQIRYLVVDTSNWWVGKKVLVAPKWASYISWAERKVYLDLSRQAIKDSPAWDAARAVNREYEARLYDYYGRPAYWGSEDRPTATRRSNYSALDEANVDTRAVGSATTAAGDHWRPQG
jgi:uncharacterized protein YrrD